MRDETGNPESDGLAAILADYLTRIDRGEPVFPARFMAEHPAHAAR